MDDKEYSKRQDEFYIQSSIEKRERRGLANKIKMIDSDDALKVARAMIRYGGGFVNNLGEALIRADSTNTAKIKDTFPEYWKQYLDMSKNLKE